MSEIISWIHFGDLHISGPGEQNDRDFVSLIDEANRHMGADFHFALLPGDNADDGEEDEYQLVKDAMSRCRFPVHAIAGDHDVAAGSLDLFQQYLSPAPYRSFTLGEYRFLLLNSVATWQPPVFGLGNEQMAWLRNELSCDELSCNELPRGQLHGRSVVFMHAYPSEHGDEAAELHELFQNSGVLLIEMGHTHYNELANDGHIIYATTRSTGQIEEGPPGFSVTTLDDGMVSWKFKPIGEWPLVMVTSPVDQRLATDAMNPAQAVCDQVQVRARVWGDVIENVSISIDGGRGVPMRAMNESTWSTVWNARECANGLHRLTVTASTKDNRSAADTILVLVNRSGQYETRFRSAVDYENALGAWPEKHILGTQLGPNENGHHWPSRRERGPSRRERARQPQ
jgi:3',5'-cyclic-AMP phosphodiesterase